MPITGIFQTTYLKDIASHRLYHSLEVTMIVFCPKKYFGILKPDCIYLYKPKSFMETCKMMRCVLHIRLRMSLQIEHFFLGFNLRAQFFLRGQVQLILAGEKLLVAVEDGILGNVLVRVGAKDDADGRVIAFAALQFIVHTNIHIHLSYVLMGDFAGFQIHQHKAFEDIVIEHEVDVVVLFLCVDMLLAGYKSISLVQLHEKFLNVRDDAAFKLALGKICTTRKPQKLRNHWVLDEFQLVSLISGGSAFPFPV